jgi:hypothetical protein
VDPLSCVSTANNSRAPGLAGDCASCPYVATARAFICGCHRPDFDQMRGVTRTDIAHQTAVEQPVDSEELGWWARWLLFNHRQPVRHLVSHRRASPARLAARCFRGNKPNQTHLLLSNGIAIQACDINSLQLVISVLEEASSDAPCPMSSPFPLSLHHAVSSETLPHSSPSISSPALLLDATSCTHTLPLRKMPGCQTFLAPLNTTPLRGRPLCYK